MPEIKGNMMSAITIQQMADRVAGLMEERLRIRGVGLAQKLGKGGRMLPRKVRTAAEFLAQAANMAQNAKLLMQIDNGAVAEAYDICLRHLGGVDAADRRRGMIVSIAASVAFSVLVVTVLLGAVLYWRGFILVG